MKGVRYASAAMIFPVNSSSRVSLLYLCKGRSTARDIQINDSSGQIIIPSNLDKIRAIIGREGRMKSDLSGAELVETSDADTQNGSSFDKNHSPGLNRLRLDQNDVNLIPAGVYTLFIDFFDAEDVDPEDSIPVGEWQNASRYVLVVEDT